MQAERNPVLEIKDYHWISNSKTGITPVKTGKTSTAFSGRERPLLYKRVNRIVNRIVYNLARM